MCATELVSGADLVHGDKQRDLLFFEGKNSKRLSWLNVL